jgi:hypothetical protein
VDQTEAPPTRTTGCYAIATAVLTINHENAELLNINNDATWTETCYKARHPNSGKSVEYKDLLNSSNQHLRTECCAEEIGHLAHGYKCTTGTNTIHFIKLSDIPHDQKAPYLRLVVAD